jgi:rod shape-determining protein MreC
MALLDIRQRTGYLFLAVMLGHVVLISTQVTSQRGVPLAEEVVFGAFAEVQRVATTSYGGVRALFQEYVGLRGVRQENERLKAEVADLRVRLQQESHTASQTRTLQALLALRERTPFATVAASVIAGGASPDFRTMTIDVGTRSGLVDNMAVIAPGGVVGRVIGAGAFATKIQLLIDRNAAAGVLDDRSRAQGIVVGTGTDFLQLTYVAGTADVQVGDTLSTSGIDGLYPKGLAVGRVESVERRAGEYSVVRVRPAVDFSSLENVLVITGATAPGVDVAATAVPAQDAR